MNKIISVVVMNLSTITQRIWMSLATVLAVAVVVAVLLAFLAMGSGFNATLEGAGQDDIAVMIRTGSQTELNSVIMGDEVNLIENAKGISRDDNGPLVSAELYLIVDGVKKSSQTKANLPFRGLNKQGIAMRGITIVEGRMFEEGKNEIMVGESIMREFEGFELGNEVKLRKSMWTVVGVFSTGGTVFESELWGDARTVQGLFERGNSFQIIRAKLDVASDISGIKSTIDQDKRLSLDVKTEKEHYASQSSGIKILVTLGYFLAIAMALGALAGALNTMYNSVAARAGEIATLRAIGFPGFPVFVGTMVESLILSLIGGLTGTLAAYVFFDGLSASTMGSSFTQIVFEFQVGFGAIMTGVIMALMIGLIGGFFPALRASNMSVLKAFTAAS